MTTDNWNRDGDTDNDWQLVMNTDDYGDGGGEYITLVIMDDYK